MNLFRATPAAYGGSQARGQIRATAASLHHSYSNTGSEPCLRHTPQLRPVPDSLIHWTRRGIKPTSSWILVEFVICWAIQQELSLLIIWILKYGIFTVRYGHHDPTCPKELKTCPYKIPHTKIYRGFIPNCQNLKQPSCPSVGELSR